MKKLIPILFSFFFYSSLSAQDSMNMTFLGSWEVDTLPAAGGGAYKYDDIWGYVDCHGNEYAIIGSASRIHFIDVTNPTAPREVASFLGGQITPWRDMKTYRDRAYAVADNVVEGLMIFDLSDLPNSITKSNQTTEDFNRAHNIFVDELNGRLYVVGSDANHILIYDLRQDPDNPVLLASNNLLVGSGSTATGGYVHDIYVRDNIGYASHGNTNSFLIWDFTIPDAPVLIASTVTSGYNHSSWVTEDGQYAIYAEEVDRGLPLGVIDLSNAASGDIETNLTFKDPLLGPEFQDATPHNPFIRDNYLIVSYYEDGLQIWDIEDPLNPVKVAYYDTHPSNTQYTGYFGNWGVYPYLPSGIMLTSHTTDGLIIVAADSIQFDTIIAPSFPDATVNSSVDDSTICLGDSVTLSVDQDAASYQWYNESLAISNANAITVNSTGKYVLEAANGHCISTSDTFDILVNPSPNGTILNTGDTELCDGETTILTVEPAASISWNLEDNQVGMTDSLIVSTSGIYDVIILNEFNCSAQSSIEINAYEAVNLDLGLSNSPTLCFGDSLTITVDNGIETYQWYNDNLPLDTDNAITINSAGSYWITASNGPCSNTSDTLEVVVNPRPIETILSSGSTEFCDGGSVFLTVPPTDSITWILNGTTIGTSDSLAVTATGTYEVNVVNEFNCNAHSSVNINVFDPVIPIISAQDNLLTSSESASYQWFVNGNLIDGATAQTHVAIVDGDYYVETTDINSCSAISNTINRLPTNINELTGVKALSIFPNPVSNLLTIKIETAQSKNLDYKLFASTGQLLQKQSLSINGISLFEIDMNEYPKGVYFLQFIDDGEQFTKKITKQ